MYENNRNFATHNFSMRITDKKYFDEFKATIGSELKDLVARFDFSELKSIEFQTIVSAVNSANIDGNSIDLETYLKYHLSKKSRNLRKG